MDVFFKDRIAQSNAGTNCRKGIHDFVVQNPEHMADLVELATDISNKNHYKAVWIIELLAESHPELLSPFTELICHSAAKYKHESAIRGI
ncbi:hypothetical protein EZL74_09225 [Flavobacterium silvisoli]|uniref:HEAT repeat domain-containing protein n=1 Tax=Flavobacterium silvisoli TaxID=2529433 RepID=A0A4Q9YVA1_9FLAO|nr:hypothetical protein [Flavobacterium silvisoli]TBX67654.1 hypothetical protein EZL74_09225 [Flavobacterium silvisoli]